MKKIICFLLALISYGCEKEEPKPGDSCKVCKEKIVSTCFGDEPVTTYGTIVTYCNNEWLNCEGDTWITTDAVNGNTNCSQEHTIICQ